MFWVLRVAFLMGFVFFKSLFSWMDCPYGMRILHCRLLSIVVLAFSACHWATKGCGKYLQAVVSGVRTATKDSSRETYLVLAVEIEILNPKPIVSAWRLCECLYERQLETEA